MKGPVERIRGWFIDRLGLDPILRFMREHKVPPGLGGKKGWAYVFGSATMVALLIQVATGIPLATFYVPTPERAHESLQELTSFTLGALLRGMHFYGASAMVVLVLLHAARVYITGSYKFPRQFNWISGVLLMVLTFLMAITGQLLRWDEDGMWTVMVASFFAARVPFIGEWLAEFIVAGPHVDGPTLTRFFGLHVLILPLAIGGLVAVHIYLLAYHGVSDLVEAGKPADPKTYHRWYKEHKESQGLRYWPDTTWREAVVGCALVVLVAALAIWLGPIGPGPAPDPTYLRANPQPDWFVRWYYALLYIKPGEYETLVMVYGPILVLIGLILLPLLFGKGPRRLKDRPWVPVVVGLVAITLGVLTYIGHRVPWTPAYETEPLTAAQLGVSEGPVHQGAQVFHARGCQYCHRVLGQGGAWGPSLTDVTIRMNTPEIRVKIVQGFGDMPSYRQVLQPGELEALLAFMKALPELEKRHQP